MEGLDADADAASEEHDGPPQSCGVSVRISICVSVILQTAGETVAGQGWGGGRLVWSSLSPASNA